MSSSLASRTHRKAALKRQGRKPAYGLLDSQLVSLLVAFLDGCLGTSGVVLTSVLGVWVLCSLGLVFGPATIARRVA